MLNRIANWFRLCKGEAGMSTVREALSLPKQETEFLNGPVAIDDAVMNMVKNAAQTIDPPTK